MESEQDRRIAAALAYDPLHAAEQEMGARAQDDAATLFLGLGMAMDHGTRKARLLTETQDTTGADPMARFLAIAQAEGFREVWRLPFTGHMGRPDPELHETLYVLWHADGILCCCTTFRGVQVNTAGIAYNWRPNDPGARWETADRGEGWAQATSTGHLRPDGVWVGHHDVREALRFKIRRLRAFGAFVNPWVARPFMPLMHYQDYEDDASGDSRASVRISAAREAHLPADVRAAILTEPVP